MVKGDSMINGIFTRYKTVNFVSTSTGTSTVTTLDKKSMVSVEFRFGDNANDTGLRIFSDSDASTDEDLIGEVNGSDRISYTAVLDAGDVIKCFRNNDANFMLHIFELE